MFAAADIPPGFVCLGVVAHYLLMYVAVRLAVSHALTGHRRTARPSL